MLDKFNAEIGYCNLALVKAGIGITEEWMWNDCDNFPLEKLQLMAEIGKEHIERYETLYKKEDGNLLVK